MRGGRHTGFKAVSTGRQQQDNTNRPNPLSLDGRGIKGEGENDASHRHVIAGLIRNPEGQCHGAAVILALRQYPQGGVKQDNTNRQNPLSLDGRGLRRG